MAGRISGAAGTSFASGFGAGMRDADWAAQAFRRLGYGAAMRTRMMNPAMLVPGSMEAMQGLGRLIQSGGAPASALDLVHMRASQINGCSVCVDSGAKHAQAAGETAERLIAVSAWRESPLFSEAERAALALAEAMTRLSDRSDAVPDEVWEDAARHYDEGPLAHLVLAIAITNLWNRLNVATPQQAANWSV